jgi:hypothetical protein
MMVAGSLQSPALSSSITLGLLARSFAQQGARYHTGFAAGQVRPQGKRALARWLQKQAVVLTRRMLWFWIVLAALTVAVVSAVVIYISTSPR